MQSRNGVDRLGDDGGDDKGVRGARDDVRNLDVELLPVVVQPAAVRGRVHAVERDDLAVCEEGVAQEADHAADGVFGAQIQRVVDSQHELDCPGHGQG